MKYNKTNNSNENSNATRKAASVNRPSRKAVEELKAAIKATEFEEIELNDYGIQIYAAYLDYTEFHEYYVIMKAGRDIMTGRYYLITREGLRIWWGRLDQNTQQHAAADFLDAIESEQRRREKYEQQHAAQYSETVEHNGHRVNIHHHQSAEDVTRKTRAIAAAVGLTYNSTFPASDMAIDCDNFAKWCNGSTDFENIDPAAPFFFAVREQGSESGTKEHARERCNHLGAPVYVLKVEREQVAGLYRLSIKVCESRPEPTTAHSETHNEPEDHNRDNNPQSTTTTATEPENEPQPAPSFWDLFADYAAGTWYSITTRAPKYWHAITTAARRVFWWLLLLFCVLSAFAVFVLVLNLLSTTTPRLWVRWLFILPSAAVAGVYTLLYCKIVDATTDARRNW